MNPYAWHSNGMEVEMATAKIGNRENAKAGFHMFGAEAELPLELVQNCFSSRGID